MKLRICLLPLLVCLLLLPVGMVAANGAETSQTTVHNAARPDTEESTLEVVGANDEDGHAETDEDSHADNEDDHSDDDAHGDSDADGHADNEDGHTDDDGHSETDGDSHADESEGHMDDEDSHAQAGDGHVSDDGHHDDQPFTWRTLLPFFAGVVAAIVAVILVKIISPGGESFDLGVVGLTALTGVLHLVLGLAGDKLLLLNGIGYLVLLVLIYLPASPLKTLRVPLRVILGLYTLATIVGYFWLHSPAQYDVLAILSKFIELFLLVLVSVSLSKAVAGSKSR